MYYMSYQCQFCLFFVWGTLICVTCYVRGHPLSDVARIEVILIVDSLEGNEWDLEWNWYGVVQ